MGIEDAFHIPNSEEPPEEGVSRRQFLLASQRGDVIDADGAAEAELVVEPQHRGHVGGAVVVEGSR